MYPNVPQFNMSSPQTGYPYAQQPLDQTSMTPGFQNQAFQAPVDNYMAGSAGPGATLAAQNTGASYPGQGVNYTQNNTPSFSSPPQGTASAPSGGGMGTGGTPGEPSEAELEALLSQLQSLSGPGGGGLGGAPAGGPQLGTGMPPGADPKGLSGHTTSGSIVAQPDGQFWDMSNGGSGGILSKLTPKNLLKLAVAGGAAWLSWYFFLKGGAAKTLQDEAKQFQEFLGNHAKRLVEVTDAIKTKSKDRIAELGTQVKDELAGLLKPFTENLTGDDANRKIAEAAENCHQELYDLAAGVSENNVTETIGKVTAKAKKAEEALQRVKSEIVDK
ncbi:MAG TPA: hypothetical protein V6C52_09215 [Coleofasciculaceae cyanobacterium]|jgi:hypothetical protein